MEAKDLKEGDKLSTAEGESATVERTEKVVHDEPVKVYNLAVLDTHTYYVGDVGVLVHNMCQKAVNDVADVADDVAKPYTKSNLKLGKEMHKAYKVDIADDITKIKEYRLPSGKRIDYIDFDAKIIYELNPHNPRAIKAGKKQLINYLNEISNLEEKFVNGWKMKLETY